MQKARTAGTVFAVALCGLMGCQHEPGVISSEACYQAMLTAEDVAALRDRWPLATEGSLVQARWCADEDIADVANQIRALTNRPNTHP